MGSNVERTKDNQHDCFNRAFYEALENKIEIEDSGEHFFEK